jgi:transposase-like protein
VDTPKGAKIRKECSMAKRKRRAFSAEFKAEAARLCRAGDRTVGQVAKDLDLTETALPDWMKPTPCGDVEGPQEAALSTNERDELTELRKR